MIYKSQFYALLFTLLLCGCCKSGMVSGTVTFKGTPCQQGNPENVTPPCQGLYPNYKVEIKTPDKIKIVTTATTDAKGAFSAKLKPGEYIICTQGGITSDILREYKFTVSKEKAAVVNAMVDTGIQ